METALIQISKAPASGAAGARLLGEMPATASQEAENQSLARRAVVFKHTKERDMAIKTVRFSVEVPDDVSDDDIEAWVAFELHALGNMSASNPMAHTDLQAKYGSVFVD